MMKNDNRRGFLKKLGLLGILGSGAASAATVGLPEAKAEGEWTPEEWAQFQEALKEASTAAEKMGLALQTMGSRVSDLELPQLDNIALVATPTNPNAAIHRDPEWTVPGETHRVMSDRLVRMESLMGYPVTPENKAIELDKDFYRRRALKNKNLSGRALFLAEKAVRFPPYMEIALVPTSYGDKGVTRPSGYHYNMEYPVASVWLGGKFHKDSAIVVDAAHTLKEMDRNGFESRGRWHLIPHEKRTSAFEDHPKPFGIIAITRRGRAFNPSVDLGDHHMGLIRPEGWTGTDLHPFTGDGWRVKS